ncbi:MAG: AI-2E family transporter, partial [Campylobacter sp.]
MREIITFAAFVVACAGISLASSIVVPFLLAIFITVAVSPLMSLLMKRRVPRGIALVVVMGIFGYIFYLFGAIIADAGSSLASDLPLYQQKLNAVINASVAWLDARGISFETAGLLKDNLERIFNSAGAVAKGTSEVLTKSFLVLLLVVFMTFEAPIFSQKIELLGSRT